MAERSTEWLSVGKITGCHGIKGWVKVHPYTDPAENFLALGEWQLRGKEGPMAVDFDAGRVQGKGLVAHIKGVDDRTAADQYRGLDVFAPATVLPALEAGDYYWRELQGLEVWCRDRGDAGSADADGSASCTEEPVLLGVVDHLIETGANDVLVVRPGPGSVDKRERLIPYLPDDVVSRVDPDRGRIEVDWYIDD
jgi:16S rRNA processing protein RimM